MTYLGVDIGYDQKHLVVSREHFIAVQLAETGEQNSILAMIRSSPKANESLNVSSL